MSTKLKIYLALATLSCILSIDNTPASAATLQPSPMSATTWAKDYVNMDVLVSAKRRDGWTLVFACSYRPEDTSERREEGYYPSLYVMNRAGEDVPNFTLTIGERVFDFNERKHPVLLRSMAVSAALTIAYAEGTPMVLQSSNDGGADKILFQTTGSKRKIAEKGYVFLSKCRGDGEGL